jgi:acyl carrier protein
MFRNLVRAPARREADSEGSLGQRLAELPEGERNAAVLELVRGEAAALLGHSSSAAVEPERAFRELGFDSLGAVELRNSLSAATGLQLSSTLVFDHPTPAAVADLIRSQLPNQGEARPVVDGEIDKLETMLRSIDERVERERVTGRVRTLLAMLIHEGEADPSAVTVERIQSATDDEIVDLIDKEFGSP